MLSTLFQQQHSTSLIQLSLMKDGIPFLEAADFWTTVFSVEQLKCE